MARQLADLMEALSSMSDVDLQAKLAQIRKNKNVVKPATAKHKRTASKKKTSGIIKLIDSMSKEEAAAMIKMLEEG